MEDQGARFDVVKKAIDKKRSRKTVSLKQEEEKKP